MTALNPRYHIDIARGISVPPADTIEHDECGGCGEELTSRLPLRVSQLSWKDGFSWHPQIAYPETHSHGVPCYQVHWDTSGQGHDTGQRRVLPLGEFTAGLPTRAEEKPPDPEDGAEPHEVITAAFGAVEEEEP